MSQPAIEAPIVSTFDPKGINQATKGFGNLEKAFKKFGLARKLSFAALTTLAVKYGREAVKAAAADEAAQRKLLGTLKNLGKEYASLGVNGFIKQQEIATGVSKDILRPELEKLLLVTNTVGEAQDLLSTALNVSAGSSYSLTQVTSALAKAQTGNLSALKKMTLGIDAATLESGNLYLIQEELNRLFAGQAAKANQGLAADMNKIRIAANNAKETIGKGLTASIDAFIQGAGGVDNVTRSMESYATSVSLALKSTEGLSSRLGQIINAPGILSNLSIDIAEGLSKALGGMQQGKGFGAETFSEDKRMFNRVQNLKAQLEITKKTTNEEKKLSDLRKKSAATTKLEQMFNNDLVSINAALQNKVTDEVRARLVALRAAKTEDQNDDKTAIMELIALQKKRADDAVVNWEAESAAAKKSFEDQYADYLALVQKFKDNAIELNYKMRVQQVMENLPSQIQSTNPQVVAVADATARVLGVTGATEARKQEAERAAVAPSLSPQVSSFLTKMREKQMQLEAENIVATRDLLDFAGYATKVGETVTSRAAVSPTIINNLEVRSGFIGNALELSQAVAEAIQNATKAGFSIDVVGVP